MLSKMLSPKQRGEEAARTSFAADAQTRTKSPSALGQGRGFDPPGILASTGAARAMPLAVLIEELLDAQQPRSRADRRPAQRIRHAAGDSQTPLFLRRRYKPNQNLHPGKIKVRHLDVTEADIVYLLPEMTEKMRTFLLSQAIRL